MPPPTPFEVEIEFDTWIPDRAAYFCVSLDYPPPPPPNTVLWQAPDTTWWAYHPEAELDTLPLELAYIRHQGASFTPGCDSPRTGWGARVESDDSEGELDPPSPRDAPRTGWGARIDSDDESEIGWQIPRVGPILDSATPSWRYSNDHLESEEHDLPSLTPALLTSPTSGRSNADDEVVLLSPVARRVPHVAALEHALESEVGGHFGRPHMNLPPASRASSHFDSSHPLRLDEPRRPAKRARSPRPEEVRKMRLTPAALSGVPDDEPMRRFKAWYGGLDYSQSESLDRPASPGLYRRATSIAASIRTDERETRHQSTAKVDLSHSPSFGGAPLYPTPGLCPSADAVGPRRGLWGPNLFEWTQTESDSHVEARGGCHHRTAARFELGVAERREQAQDSVRAQGMMQLGAL